MSKRSTIHTSFDFPIISIGRVIIPNSIFIKKYDMRRYKSCTLYKENKNIVIAFYETYDGFSSITNHVDYIQFSSRGVTPGYYLTYVQKEENVLYVKLTKRISSKTKINDKKININKLKYYNPKELSFKITIGQSYTYISSALYRIFMKLKISNIEIDEKEIITFSTSDNDNNNILNQSKNHKNKKYLTGDYNFLKYYNIKKHDTRTLWFCIDEIDLENKTIKYHLLKEKDEFN